MTTSRTEEWTVEGVLELTRDEVVELWKTLPAPDFTEMNGEYRAHVPTKGAGEEFKKRVAEVFDENRPRGYWLGKSYRPLSATRGEGYNHSRMPDGTIVRRTRFSTELGTSFIDGKPALMMYYGAFNNRLGDEDMVDEMRKLTDGLYIGCATRRMPDGTRPRLGPFLLSGPTGPWVGVDDENAEQK